MILIRKLELGRQPRSSWLPYAFLSLFLLVQIAMSIYLILAQKDPTTMDEIGQQLGEGDRICAMDHNLVKAATESAISLSRE